MKAMSICSATSECTSLPSSYPYHTPTSHTTEAQQTYLYTRPHSYQQFVLTIQTPPPLVP